MSDRVQKYFNIYIVNGSSICEYNRDDMNTTIQTMILLEKKINKEPGHIVRYRYLLLDYFESERRAKEFKSLLSSNLFKFDANVFMRIVCRNCITPAINIMIEFVDVININKKDERGLTLLHEMCLGCNNYHDCHTSVISMIRIKGGDVNVCDDEGKTPLHYACCIKDVGYVDELLNCNNININARDIFGNTPLHTVCSSLSMGRHSIAGKLLSDSRINVNAVNNEGRTALHTTCILFQDELMNMLISRGIDKNVVDKYGNKSSYYLYNNIVVTRLKIECEDNNSTEIQKIAKYVGSKEFENRENIIQNFHNDFVAHFAH